MKRFSIRMHWSTVRPASSAVATATRSTTGVPHTSVIAATAPFSPRHPPTTSSQTSIFHSGFCSTVSSVQSAVETKWSGSWP